MNRLAFLPPKTQGRSRSIAEIITDLAHPLILSAARLEWLAAESDRDETDAAAFGNGEPLQFSEWHANALRIAAEELRASHRRGHYEAGGISHSLAIAILDIRAFHAEMAAQEEAAAKVPGLSLLCILPQTATGKAGLAAVYRHAIEVLKRDCALGLGEFAA